MSVKGFILFLKRKWVVLFLIILLCATYGSVRGASKEHTRQPWITYEDVQIRRQIDSGELDEKDYPSHIGYLGLACEQNEFYNIKLAIACGILGIFPALVMLTLYYILFSVCGFDLNKIISQFKHSDTNLWEL